MNLSQNICTQLIKQSCFYSLNYSSAHLSRIPILDTGSVAPCYCINLISRRIGGYRAIRGVSYWNKRIFKSHTNLYIVNKVHQKYIFSKVKNSTCFQAKNVYHLYNYMMYMILPPFFWNGYSRSVANSKFHSSASPCHCAQGLVCGDI